MSEERDLTDWVIALDKQIEIEKYQNKAPFRVCKNCGDKGFHLSRSRSLDMHYLVAEICECNTGQNLITKWNTTLGENKYE